MCDEHMSFEAPRCDGDRRGARVATSALDNAEIVITAKCARPATLLAEIAADPERAAALALAHGYVDQWNTIGRSERAMQRARHYYRVALGLETMDAQTGEA